MTDKPKAYVVYFLVDPRSFDVFYVGMTSKWGVRHEGHKRELLAFQGGRPPSERGRTHSVEKLSRMQEIYDAGHQVLMMKIHTFSTIEEARLFEARLIRQMGGITNRSGRDRCANSFMKLAQATQKVRQPAVAKSRDLSMPNHPNAPKIKPAPAEPRVLLSAAFDTTGLDDKTISRLARLIGTTCETARRFLSRQWAPSPARRALLERALREILPVASPRSRA